MIWGDDYCESSKMMTKSEILWKQYQQHIDTYKFYLDITVKLVGFYFAVSGAMLSFYYTHTDIESAKLALYLPWLMSLGLFVLFTVGARLSVITRNDLFKIRDELELDVAPDLGMLTILLSIFSLVVLACLIGLSYVVWS